MFLLAVAGARAAEESPAIPGVMASSKLEVRFDAKTHEPREIVNRRTKERLDLVPESSFRLELVKLTEKQRLTSLVGAEPATIIDARECTPGTAKQNRSAGTSDVRTLHYRCESGRVTVEYILGANEHFFQKSVRFEPGFAEPYLLRRVSVQQFRFSSRPRELFPFHHGRSVTHFVRRAQGGFFFGVQVPLEVDVAEPDGSIQLDYPVNYRYRGSEAYTAEPAFWGVYRRTGKLAPKVPEYFDECRNSTVPPDLGESRAMLEMVLRLTRPRSRAVTINYNSWMGGLSKNGYGKGAGREDVEQDKKVLRLAKEQFGEFYSNTTIPWGGLGYGMPAVGPEQTEPLASPLQREMLAWAKQNRIGMHTWAPIKGICPWQGLHRYCPKHEAWWGRHEDVEYNCPANRPFMEWFTRLLVALVRRDGYGGYALDEGPPYPRTGLPCDAEGHDHLPGEAGYGYFVARRQLFQTLRKEFGPDFHLEAARPNMDAGIWDARYVDSVFTLSENACERGDDIRYRSRIRHFYHFFPSYLDQLYFRPGKDDPDYLMLSALAVSNTHIVYGIGRTPDERRRVRHWYDWARKHGSLMQQQAIFLPDWPVARSIAVGGSDTERVTFSPYKPGEERCDSYLRLGEDGRGFAFVFNSNEKEAQAVIPLNGTVGLEAAQSYRVERVFPELSQEIPDRLDAQGEIRFTLPPRSVALLSIQPKA